MQSSGLKLAIVAVGVLLLNLTPDPQAFTVAMRQAEIHRAGQEYGAAVEAYFRAASLAPDSTLPWQRVGEILMQQHRFAEARDAFRVASLGGGAEALLALGDAFAAGGDWAAALTTWYGALPLAPQDARLYLALGRGMIAQGQLEPAADYLRRALDLEPRSNVAPSSSVTAAAHGLLGRLLAGDDMAKAAGHLSQAGDSDMLAVLQAVSAEPEPAGQASLLGIAFLQRDELTLARCQLERAVALDPANAQAHAYLGHVLDRQGHTLMAQDKLRQALALDPDLVIAYYFLGIHHRRTGYVREAQATLWQGLLRDPQNAALRVQMAEAYLDLGDYEGAEEWYQGAVDVVSEDQQFDFQLILAHFYLDHLYHIAQGGVPAAEAAAMLAPDDARAQDLLGWAYHLAGRHAEAEQALVKALALAPDLVSARYHLGSLYAGTGRPDLARQHLQRAADLDTGGYYRERAASALRDLE
ncbi:MAG: tetratricopeptide repeat protein [Anaerolineae bacterium]|nr:tetratricopeptide repeat protein [Anaerolineae bacterium]